MVGNPRCFINPWGHGLHVSGHEPIESPLSEPSAKSILVLPAKAKILRDFKQRFLAIPSVKVAADDKLSIDRNQLVVFHPMNKSGHLHGPFKSGRAGLKMRRDKPAHHDIGAQCIASSYS